MKIETTEGWNPEAISEEMIDRGEMMRALLGDWSVEATMWWPDVEAIEAWEWTAPDGCTFSDIGEPWEVPCWPEEAQKHFREGHPT